MEGYNNFGGDVKKYKGENPIIPKDIDIIISSKTYLKNQLIIPEEQNLVSTNIKKGIEIFGVKGEYEYTGQKRYEKQYIWSKNTEQTTNVNINFHFPGGMGGSSQINFSKGQFSNFTRQDFINIGQITGPDDGYTRFYYYFRDDDFLAQRVDYYLDPDVYYHSRYDWNYSPDTGIVTWLFQSAYSDTTGDATDVMATIRNKRILNFINFVGSNTSNLYPNDGPQNGYYYVKK